MAENRSIAIVEDEPLVRNALHRLLRSKGYVVDAFASGEAFLLAIKDSLPACVLLDVNLSGISGFDVKYELEEAGVDIPVVMITGGFDPVRERPGILTSDVEVLHKPFQVDEVCRAIRAAIRAHEEVTS